MTSASTLILKLKDFYNSFSKLNILKCVFLSKRLRETRPGGQKQLGGGIHAMLGDKYALCSTLYRKAILCIHLLHDETALHSLDERRRQHHHFSSCGQHRETDNTCARSSRAARRAGEIRRFFLPARFLVGILWSGLSR